MIALIKAGGNMDGLYQIRIEALLIGEWQTDCYIAWQIRAEEVTNQWGICFAEVLEWFGCYDGILDPLRELKLTSDTFNTS